MLFRSGEYGSSGSYGILGQNGSYGVYSSTSMYCTGTYQGSDQRLKENIVQIKNGLSIICSLNPVSFNWKLDTRISLNHGSAKPDFGLIAQEVELIIPLSVDNVPVPKPIEERAFCLEETLEEVKSINYIKIIPFLISAIQELKNELDEYKKTHP